MHSLRLSRLVTGSNFRRTPRDVPKYLYAVFSFQLVAALFLIGHLRQKLLGLIGSYLLKGLYKGDSV